MDQTTVVRELGLRTRPAVDPVVGFSDVDGLLGSHGDASAQGGPRNNGCTHWPLDGEARIRAASDAYLRLAELLVRARPPEVPTFTHNGGCIDLSVVANVDEVDALFEFTDTAVSRLVQLRREVVELANQYQTTGRWLSESVASAWANVRAVQPPPKCASVLDEGHRVIAKDWLTADLNLLVGTLLRRAIRPVDRLDLSPAAIRSDLAGPRHCEVVLQSVADMLDRAAALVGESTQFVEEIDGCLRRFRQQVVAVVALAQAAEAALPATADS